MYLGCYIHSEGKIDERAIENFRTVVDLSDCKMYMEHRSENSAEE